MPNYDKIVEESQANVTLLGEKLKGLDQLYQDINSLKTKPESILLAFDKNFKEITELFKQYQQTLAEAAKMYLDGSNSLFTSKLNELADKNAKLETEISRLVNTDLTKLFADLQKGFMDKTSEDLSVELKRFEDNSTDFQDKIHTLKAQISRLIGTDFDALFKDLQKQFIEQTKKDLDIELNKIGATTTDFQTKINSFGEEINRLEKIDLEKGFDKLQKTLSDIFGAINTVNLSLVGLTTSLNPLIQSLGQLQTIIKDSLNEQNKKNEIEFEFLKTQIANLTEKNSALKKDIYIGTIMQVVGFLVTLSLLLGIFLK